MDDFWREDSSALSSSWPSSMSMALCLRSDSWRVSIFRHSLGLEKSFSPSCLMVLAFSLYSPTSPFLMPFSSEVRGLEKLWFSDHISSKLFCRFLSFFALSLLRMSCFFSFSYSSRHIYFSKESFASLMRMLSTLEK